MMLILIDADPIVYRCGFASEKTEWHVTYEDMIGEVQEIHFAPTEDKSANARMKEWIEFQAERITVLHKVRHAVPDPVSYALRSVKVQLESIVKECGEHYGTTDIKTRLYLSGGKNYRDKIARVRPYKGNRDPAHKPVHYGTIRDYLQARGALITNGIEADDAVSIYAHWNAEQVDPEHIVIATIDKDLDQIPGDHYNYMSKVFYAISEFEAGQFFWYQCLAGDITDNIIGCWKCGDAAATSIVANFSSSQSGRIRGSHTGIPADPERHLGASSASSGASSASSENQCATSDRRHISSIWRAIVSAYAASQGKAGCPYAQDNPYAIALEMAQLVKLQEYPGQLWCPDGDKVVPGFELGEFDD